MFTIVADYRIPMGQKGFENIKQKKDALVETIYQEHPKQRIEYEAVRNKKSRIYTEFCNIYNYSCAYCGVKVGIMDAQLFEVDHFICESSYQRTTTGRAVAGKLSNLVLSCYNCNRRKGNFRLDGNDGQLLNPDNGAISKVFYRNEDFYIKIVDKYQTNQVICQFYKRLNLDSELKRLDYLLLNMKELAEEQKESNPQFSNSLKKSFSDLLYIRNMFSNELARETNENGC